MIDDDSTAKKYKKYPYVTKWPDDNGNYHALVRHDRLALFHEQGSDSSAHLGRDHRVIRRYQLARGLDSVIERDHRSVTQ